MLSLLIALVALSFAAAQQRPAYTHQATLDTRGDFIIRWLPGPNDIIFECEVRTRGWLGIGFSSNGAMTAADIVIAWIDQNGTPQISDRHGPIQGNGFPPPDDTQNYQLISGRKNQTHIVVSFRRLLDTCDQNDWKITSDTTRMIWAKNDQVPTSAQNIQQHSERGVHSVHLLTNETGSGLSQLLADRSVTPFDLGVTNVPIPNNQRTLYWCKVIQLPVSAKKHIVASEMMVQRGNEPYVHHLLLYGCGNNDMSQYINRDGPCYNDTNLFAPMQLCTSVIGAWAVGGAPFVYASNMGAPIFENNNQRFVLIEMHYDNPQMLPGLTDSSFYRMYLTSNLRPVETGRLTTGAPVRPTSILIPPRQSRFTIYSYCPSSCTSRLTQPMNVFSGILHTHLHGVAVKLRVFRQGTELKPVMKDDHYDFNYQNSILLSTPLQILPGDDLVTECIYDTSQADKPAYGGFQTTQEMCFAFLEYYPKRNITAENCMSFTNPEELLKLLGARSFADALEMSPTVINQNNQNKSLIDWYNNDVNWNSNTVNMLQNFMKNPPHIVFCDIQSSDPRIAANASSIIMNMTQPIPMTRPYVEPSTCATTNPNFGAQNNNNNMYNSGNNNMNNNYNTPGYNPGSSYNPNSNNVNMNYNNPGYTSGNNYNPNSNMNNNYNNPGPSFNPANYNPNSNVNNGNGNSASTNLFDQIGRLIQWAMDATNRS